MRNFRMLGAAALLGVVGILACEGTTPSAPSASEATHSLAPVDLGADIRSLIDAGFPKGLATSINAKWDQTLRSLAKDPRTTLKGKIVPGSGGRTELTRTIDFIEKKTAESTPPAGETQAHFVARLVLEMSLYVYGGPTAQPPPLSPTSDVAFKLVQPATTDTVVTTAKRAAVIFPAGAVSEPTVVVITPITGNYSENCSGPLVTHFCQYPLFYTYNVFPDVKLNVPAHVQVCHVDAGSNRLPLAPLIHDRFRVAHDAPALADKSAGSVIVDGIEVLALVPMAVTACAAGDGTTYTPPIAMSLDQGAFGALRLSASLVMHRVASAVRHALAPREAFAIDVGGGGSAEIFSTFGVVDTLGVADLAQSTGSGTTPGTPFTVTAPVAPLYAGGTVAVPAWTVTNAGTTTSGTFTSSVVLSASSDLSAPIAAATVAAIGATTPLAPRALRSYAATTVTLPSGLTAGTYYVGTVITPGGPDATAANNQASVAVTVSPPPAGSISGRVENAFDHSSLSGATVSDGTRSTTSNADGTFVLGSVPVGTANVTGGAPGFASATRSGVLVTSGNTTNIGTLSLAPLPAAGNIRIVLDWGACNTADPLSGPVSCDLDSHLSGPTAGESRFHVFYNAPSFSDATSIATLDIDHTDGSGPETITISQYSSGRYHYYVHDYLQYCCSGPVLTASAAHVRVYFGASQVAEFFGPTTGSGNGWDVFTLTDGAIAKVDTLITMVPTTVLASRLAPTTRSASSPNALDTDLARIIQDIVNSPKTTASPSVNPFRKP